MKKLVILTANRAEYGLLSPIIKKFMIENEIEVKIVVTGAHLSPEFGYTVNEILNDGINIDKKIEVLLSSDTSIGVSKAMGLAMISFSEYFNDEKPDALMVLGDRYEILAVCIAALNARVPIIHLHGGEITEGAIDDAVRNAVTKMSFLHFASTEQYRRRIIQMGEEPDRVFNVGAMGVENAMNIALNAGVYSKRELEKQLGCKLDKYAILTFHPVTLEKQQAELEAKELMQAVSKYEDIVFICTKANADAEGRLINTYIQKYTEKYSNIHLYNSLGMKRYMSALRYAEFVIGNSSSGIIEVPSFNIPTINIGDRQKGRIQAKTVINCEANKESIIKSIDKALSKKFRKQIVGASNPYGDGKTSEKIVNITKKFMIENKLKVRKKFFDL